MTLAPRAAPATEVEVDRPARFVERVAHQAILREARVVVSGGVARVCDAAGLRTAICATNSDVDGAVLIC